MSDDILGKVQKIVSEQLGVDEAEVKPDANFANDLGADSLDTVELVMALEEEFDIEIPDEAAEGISTVQSAVDFIKSIHQWDQAPGIAVLGKCPTALSAAYLYRFDPIFDQRFFRRRSPSVAP